MALVREGYEIGLHSTISSQRIVKKLEIDASGKWVVCPKLTKGQLKLSTNNFQMDACGTMSTQMEVTSTASLPTQPTCTPANTTAPKI